MKESKISGGAYKYIQNFYGENDMSYPGGVPGPGKLSEAQSTELDSNGDGELTGKDFESLGSSKMGDPDPKKKNTLPSYTETSYKGSTTSKGGDSNSSTSSTTSNVGNSSSNYDSVVKSEGTAQVDPSLITPAMTASANKKRADAKAKDASINASSNSQTQSSTSQNNESSSKTVSLGNQTRAQIEKGGQTQMSNRIKKIAAKKEAVIAQSSIDSTNTSNKEYDKLMANTTYGGRALQKQSRHDYIAKKANVSARRGMVNSGLFNSKEITNNFSYMGGNATVKNPGISGNIGKASDFGGPNKGGVHSSKSQGINKILKGYNK